MLIYTLIYVFLLVFIYIDYKCYTVRIEKTLKEQPDFEENENNYQNLAKKFYAHQRKISTASAVIFGLLILLILLFMNSGLELK